MSKAWRVWLYLGFGLRVVGFCQEWCSFPYQSSPLSWAGYAIVAVCMYKLIKALEQ